MTLPLKFHTVDISPAKEARTARIVAAPETSRQPAQGGDLAPSLLCIYQPSELEVRNRAFAIETHINLIVRIEKCCQMSPGCNLTSWRLTLKNGFAQYLAIWQKCSICWMNEICSSQVWKEIYVKRNIKYIRSILSLWCWPSRFEICNSSISTPFFSPRPISLGLMDHQLKQKLAQ